MNIKNDNKTKYLEKLRHVNIFRGVSDSQLIELLSSNEVLLFNKNNYIFEQGSLGTYMYVVLEGEVSLLVDPEKMIKEATIGSIGLHTISKIMPGQSFGELALFDQKPRSVSAVASKDQTLLLSISMETFGSFFAQGHVTGKTSKVLNNIIADIAEKLRNANHTLINEMLSVYFVKNLIEELQFSLYECSYVNPLKKQAIIHVPEHFILDNYIHHTKKTKKEIIDIYFLTEVKTLKNLIDDTYPSGEVIINTLLSIIRSGKIPARVNQYAFEVKLYEADDFKKGTLIIRKDGASGSNLFFINFELKGIIHTQNQQFTYANLFLTISHSHKKNAATECDKIIKSFLMPIQNNVCALLPKNYDASKYRLIVIHHRTNEVVNTIEQLKNLGYKLDVLIGIPYGEVDWKTILTLDYASNHKFQSLKTVTDPKQPIKYVFDFKASSFLPLDVEASLLKLFEDPKVNSYYITAMEALIEYSLVKSINNCFSNNEKLIVFEDGGYIANMVYRIYHDNNHHLHPLIKQAVEEHILVGIVEGTMSGERVHRKYLAAHDNKALLPILSSAVSQLKVLFESKGIAESIIYASSTALGRLGLPAFQERRMAVIGGNGTIGRRVIEQIVGMHNSTSEVAVVDINPLQAHCSISDNLSFLKERISYTNLPRYNIDNDCEYFWLPYEFNKSYEAFEQTNIYKKLYEFLNSNRKAKELLLLNNSSKIKIESLIKTLFDNLKMEYKREVKDDNIKYHIPSIDKDIIFLNKNTVLNATELNDFIINHIDTIIGVTGVTVIHAHEIVKFILRDNHEEVDQIVFISGSSKDNEFKDGIAFLDALVRINTEGITTEDKNLYASELKQLNFPYTISKYIHPDVGISYQVEINGKQKIFHMLANGLVINFFAKHEKGAKAEYIDPIVTLQLLSVIHFAQDKLLAPGLYDSAKVIDVEMHKAILAAINEKCKPLFDTEA